MFNQGTVCRLKLVAIQPEFTFDQFTQGAKSGFWAFKQITSRLLAGDQSGLLALGNVSLGDVV